MKCIVCKKEAVIKLPSHHSAFCVEHFLQFFLRRVDKAIRRYRMFHANAKILVAVSGGKDSLVLWSSLLELGYDASGIFINLGIEPNSDIAEDKVKQFAKENNAQLHIVDVKDYLGATIPEVNKIVKKPICSVCGMVRRYILNSEAKRLGYSVLATGHNLDDEAATLLGNTLHWYEGYLKRQYPTLGEEQGFVRKVKPLVLCSEKETLAYAVIRQIDFDSERCPFSRGATSQFYKHILNLIEHDMPGTKQNFLCEFFRKMSGNIYNSSEKDKLTPCEICGYPTSAGKKCSFCRLKEQIGGETYMSLLEKVV
ncbi:adenine nucleotide alpha hydrolase family protein [bacterium]|nr:adenine nucleotide alpha hydrolase family protein [bacterium]